MSLLGEFFNRKLPFSIDQPMSRFLHLTLLPANGPVLGCSLLPKALASRCVPAPSRWVPFWRCSFRGDALPINTFFLLTPS